MMKNNRPYTNENGSEDAGLITERPKEEMGIVLKWIADNIVPRETPMMDHTSYGIKHILEHDIGLYLTNNEFKDAMLLSGYEPVDPNKLNWNFRISRKSPAFDWRSRQ